jgi:RNA polymerase primary sigma factor
MEVAHREEEVVNAALDFTPWVAFAELTALREEADEDPYLANEEAEKPDHEDVAEPDANIAGIYFREVSKVPLLTRKKEIELAKRIQLGEKKIHLLLRESSTAEEEINRLGRELSRSEIKPRKLIRSREEVIGELMRKLEELSNHPGNNGIRFRELLTELRETEADVKGAKAEMIQSNLRLVACIAKRYINRGLSFLDLIQEGNLGLMKAVGRYDYRRGYKFSTYASWWIRQAITRALGDKSRIIRIPNHLLEMKSKIVKGFHQLVKELGRKPLPEEIAEKTKMPLTYVEKIIELIQEPISLETPVGDDGGKLEDLMKDEETSSFADDLLESMDQARKTRNLLSHLNWREEQILRLRFGIGEQSPSTLEEVGKRFHISRERVRQIEQKAINKLRAQRKAAAVQGAFSSF